MWSFAQTIRIHHISLSRARWAPYLRANAPSSISCCISCLHGSGSQLWACPSWPSTLLCYLVRLAHLRRDECLSHTEGFIFVIHFQIILYLIIIILIFFLLISYFWLLIRCMWSTYAWQMEQRHFFSFSTFLFWNFCDSLNIWRWCNSFSLH